MNYNFLQLGDFVIFFFMMKTDNVLMSVIVPHRLCPPILKP